MTSEQLQRGKELQEQIEKLKEEIRECELGLRNIDEVSIKITCGSFCPFDLEEKLREKVMKMFKAEQEATLKELQEEFDKL